MSLERLYDLETIDPTPLPPCRPEAFTGVVIKPDREVAIEQAEATRFTLDIVLYSDVSGRQGHLGAAVVALDGNLEITEFQ